MWAKHLRLGTQFVHKATNKSKAAITVGGVEHTGTVCSAGNSPFVFLLWRTILDAGNIKSSTISYKAK